jgi:hypothetical protein
MVKSENVRVLLLSTGSPVMAEVMSETDDAYVVNNMIRVIEDPRQPGAVAFGPFLSFVKEENIKILKEHVVIESVPVPEIVEGYCQMHSNIVVAKDLPPDDAQAKTKQILMG